MAIKIDGMADAIIRELELFAGLVQDDVIEAQKAAGKKAAQQIKTTAPRMTGEYAKSWKSKTTVKGKDISTTVYAGGKEYTIAHLVEFGHANVNGGRTPGYEHIAPAEQAAIGYYESELKRRIEGGS